jgi:hypothetical protein
MTKGRIFQNMINLTRGLLTTDPRGTYMCEPVQVVSDISLE